MFLQRKNKTFSSNSQSLHHLFLPFFSKKIPINLVNSFLNTTFAPS
ncbi:hypothetical protein HMPREF9078_01222 [Capnocytophaga sp. oral taxon 380 str. F0488]|nr:hypothetical protein HMPREF9078_01222 [Capnocytophaga sp. oral taxon 380 str. F0488]